MRQLSGNNIDSANRKMVVFGVVIVSVIAISYLSVFVDNIISIATIFLSVLVVFITVLFKKPIFGLFSLLAYSFILPFSRELNVDVQWGIGQEILLLLTWIAVIFSREKNKWSVLNSDIVWLVIAWFGLSVLEVANPNGASIAGWFFEIRTTALLLVLIIPLTLLLFTRASHLDIFLKTGILLSLFATLIGLKQLYLGLFPGEARFLMQNAGTHLIYGQLRVFSFYTDAGQFGASQAHFALICFILAMGPFSTRKRFFLIIAGIALFYGMMISGTRGAFFVLSGASVGLILTRNFRALALGVVCMIGLVMFLKFTSFGQGNYHIRRLRTAVNPTTDASYQVRLNSQLMLQNYLRDKPIGGGLGTIGINGKLYNPGSYLASIEPDSYWVKVWAMYGIVGLTFWFGLMLYLLGKCCGIVWKIQDPMLRIKLIALVSGSLGIFIASYGNEVINRIPSSVVVLMSLAIVYLAPRWDTDLRKANLDMKIGNS